MALSFEYSHEFKSRTVDEVFDRIMLWLNKEKAQKITSEGRTGI